MCLKLAGRRNGINEGLRNNRPIFLSMLGLTLLREYLIFQLQVELLLKEHLVNFKVLENGNFFLTENDPSCTVSVIVSVLAPKPSVAFWQESFCVSKNHTNAAVLVRHYIHIAHMFNAACLRLYFAWA